MMTNTHVPISHLTDRETLSLTPWKKKHGPVYPLVANSPYQNIHPSAKQLPTALFLPSQLRSLLPRLWNSEKWSKAVTRPLGRDGRRMDGVEDGGAPWGQVMGVLGVDDREYMGVAVEWVSYHPNPVRLAGQQFLCPADSTQ